MKRIAVLGSSGSVGTTTLKVIEQQRKEFKLEAITVNRNVMALKEQIARFRPSKVAIAEGGNLRNSLIRKVGKGVEVCSGVEGLEKIASDRDIDIVVVALSGSIALRPLLAAIRSGKQIALANKEALVMAGAIIMRELKNSDAKIIPVDSEQSAIFQCLEGRSRRQIGRLYLTASGGALYDVPAKKFKYLKLRQILNHPRWKMGRKITVDSATMMNKGLEIIEASWLFDISVLDIEVLIHRQAIIHSMVEFIDGIILAQLGETDMALPIQYALSYPDRLFNERYRLDFLKVGNLTFTKPDIRKFPCLDFAYQAARDGGNAPCVMNAANEEAVNAFLNRRIDFIAIPKVIEKIMSSHKVVQNQSLNALLEADSWARQEARKIILNIN